MEKKKAIAKIDETRKMPSQLIQAAIDKGNVDLDKLEKVMALQERWEANEAKKAYHESMAAFKANPPQIGKDKKVGYQPKSGGGGPVQYSHASLYNVTEKINTALSKHGLSAAWTTKQNGNIIVTCKITHQLGHSEETTLQAQADTTGSKNAIQAIGSTVSYLSRYTLLALTGLATFDQGDDGQAAAIERIDEKQEGELRDYIAEKKVDVKKFCVAFSIKEITELPKAKFAQAITMIKAKK